MTTPWKKVHDQAWEDSADLLHKREVEGGFLYRNIWISRGIEHISMVFVPITKCKCCDYALLLTCGNCNDEMSKRRT